MPIPRRTSHSAPPAPTQGSGVYRAGSASLTELDEAFDGLDELEEVFDDDFPDVPSLMPSATVLAELPEVPALDLAPPRFAEPQRRRSLEAMQAVRAPEPVAAAPTEDPFDSSFLDDDQLDIPLDIKAPPSSRVAITTLAGGELAPVSSTQTAIDPKPGIVAFAGYGLPPEKLGGTPAYAFRVFVRKWQLRDDLRVARMRRIADVSLYEAALGCADESAVTKGIALATVCTLGTLGAIVAAASFLL